MDRELRTAAVCTLGCKINTFESLAIKERLLSAGLELVRFGDKADLYIINTCTVTSRTDAESRQMIRRAMRANPDGVVAVTGCYAQMNADDLKSMTGVSYIFDNTAKHDIVNHILNDDAGMNDTPVVVTDDILKRRDFVNFAPKTMAGRNRAFLKIQDGCDSFCSYCLVPLARGGSRSLPVKEVLRSVNSFVEAGFKEIVLTGVHIGRYGHDFTEEASLTGLMKEIEKSTDIPRLRVSSIESNEITDQFVEFATASKIMCNHLHIPLQSGDDKILTRMNRNYTTGDFSAVMKRVKSGIKDVIIGADVITGFPGESNERFTNTFKFIEDSDIDYLHVFPYSKRGGTKAYDMPDHIDGSVKKFRAHNLRGLGEKKRLKAYKRLTGKSVKALFERRVKKDGALRGITRNYLNVMTSDFTKDMLNEEIEFIVDKVEIRNGKPVIVLQRPLRE